MPVLCKPARRDQAPYHAENRATDRGEAHTGAFSTMALQASKMAKIMMRAERDFR